MPHRALSLVPHAVVLCGPQGGPALHPLPGPPALLPVGNEPAVGFLLRALEAAGTRSAILMCATDQVASKLSAWAAKHWPSTSRLSLAVRTSPPGAGSGGALAAALDALDLPPGSPLTVAPADLVTESEPLGRAFLAHFKAGATVTALLAHRRVSPASETKPGRAPRGVTYVALAGGGGGGGGGGGDAAPDAAAALAEAEPALLHLAVGPSDPGAPPAREVALPLAALAAAAAASSSAGGAGTAALTLRSDLAAAGLFVLDADAAAGALAVLAARAGGGGGGGGAGGGAVSVSRDLIPYLLRRQFTPREGVEEGCVDGSATAAAAGGAAAKATAAAAAADAAATAPPATSTGAAAAAAPATPPPPRPVCQAHLAPRGRVCGRACTVQAYLELNRDVAAADPALRGEGAGGRGGGGGGDGGAPPPPPPASSAPPPAAIHPSTTLGAKAAVSPASIVGPDCALGDRCSVKKSVLGAGVAVGKGAKVVNSVLGAGAVVGEGASLQNALICAGGRVGSRAVVRDARVGPGAEVFEGGEAVEETVGGELAVGSL